MRALSILQPWAWLIVQGHKAVENRRWSTTYRGPFLVHAGKRWGREQREDLAFVREAFPEIELPDTFKLGGIVGAARVVDCVSTMDDPWFFGPHGFVLADARHLPFIPYRGQLSWFDIPLRVVREALPEFDPNLGGAR